MADCIDIKKLTDKELAGVVNLYPWYGGARKEFCLRLSRVDDNPSGNGQYGEAAMYVVDRSKIAGLICKGRKEDCSDKDIEQLVKSYIGHESEGVEKPQVRVVSGDFFSQADYDAVKKEGDDMFARFTVSIPKEIPGEAGDVDLDERFITETLARVYEEQGYYEQARQIYSRLLLKFPEKSIYFATLVGKLEKQKQI